MIIRKGPVTFDPVTHTYNHDTLGKLTSPSSILKQVSPPFEATEAKTKKTQEKLGITHEEVLELWKKKNEKSLIYGEFVHRMVENYFLPNPSYIDYIEENYELLQEHLLEFGEYLRFLKSLNIKQGLKSDNFFVEDFVYDEETMLVGTPDLRIHKKNSMKIKDWKTNGKSLISWFDAKGYLLEPFNFMKNCDINKYRIQTCIYGYLAKKMYNLEIESIEIIHFHPKECKVYEIEYNEDLVHMWLNHVQNKKIEELSNNI